MIRALACLLALLLPGRARTAAFNLIPGYHLHPTARIGWAFVCVPSLRMGAHSSIGTATVIRHIAVVLGNGSSIGRGNWITGEPATSTAFAHRPREPLLELGDHACLTHRHIVDCTAAVRIGPFATVAGWNSQIVTHGIDLIGNRQDCQPITIGAHALVDTRCLLLGGCRVPERSLIGAGAVVVKDLGTAGWLYGGVPARPIRELDPSAAYFQRTTGPVG
jgi:acetyltransferase-like isoleucine patch superfamily enzyme